MALSVAACAHYYAAAYLHGRGLPTDDVTVEVEADKDRLPQPRLARLMLRVRVPAGLAERHFAGIERAIRSCPAYGTLLHPPSVEFAVDSNAAPDAELAHAGSVVS
jgi:uncharacterized OsmC-like protein